MFTAKDSSSGFSVDDTAQALKFYGNILEMNIKEGEMGTLDLSLENGGNILIYPKEDHKPAEFTVLNFRVKDILDAVNDLKNKGVTFERYTVGPVKTDEDGIFRGGGPLIAWFRDPAGNILSVMQI